MGSVMPAFTVRLGLHCACAAGAARSSAAVAPASRRARVAIRIMVEFSWREVRAPSRLPVPCQGSVTCVRPGRETGRRLVSAARLVELGVCADDRSATGPHDVLRGQPLVPRDEVELDGLTLGERLEAVALDGAVMHERVLLAAVGGDETEALRVV